MFEYWISIVWEIHPHGHVTCFIHFSYFLGFNFMNMSQCICSISDGHLYSFHLGATVKDDN